MATPSRNGLTSTCCWETEAAKKGLEEIGVSLEMGKVSGGKLRLGGGE